MAPTQTVGSVTRSRPRALSRRVLSTVGVVFACLCSSGLAISFAQERWLAASGLPADTPLSDRLALAFLAALVVAVGTAWRRSHPLELTVAAAAAALVFPLDSLAILIGLAHLVARRQDRWVWVGGGAAALGTSASVWRDTRHAGPGPSFWRDLVAGSPPAPGVTAAPLTWWAPVVIVVVLLGLAVGAGLLLRTRRDLRTTRAAQRTDRAAVGRLNEEVGRQAERERIAREVHDVLGHRLSLLSLHAGALEVAAADDPRLQRSAGLVRQGAQESMDDLRSLLAVLRHPEQDLVDQRTPSLAELPRVIDEGLGAGMPLHSTIYLDGAGGADRRLAQAVYRIVQELLTNARKHAPGAPVRLRVEGDVERGIRIEAVNHPLAHPTPSRGSGGSGLAGVAERAAQLGGGARFGLDQEGVFRVDVWLPWASAADVATQPDPGPDPLPEPPAAPGVVTPAA